jgi:energy-coupling factor transporter ATP-binding protein EcfA2
LGTLEGHAIHEGPSYPVHVRLAEKNGKIYLDLGSDRFEVVEITRSGWRVIDDQNIVKFRRPSGLAALPYPKEDGKIEALKRYVNLSNTADWPLIVGFILGCFHPVGPYPILAVTGEQGSAKSTLLKVIKSITDPSTAPLRSTPKELRDLAISANNTWTLAFDNLSDIPVWLSDGLCRLSTGGGFATRTLYSDDEETIFDSKRPVLVNCIDNVIRRHDLADRAIIVELGVIPAENRIPESKFWADFNEDAPEIMGAILAAVSCALRNVDAVQLRSYPRMADFAKWITAAESSLGWKPETFLTSYLGNRQEVTSLTLEADLVGTTVKTFMEERTSWEGTASDLMHALEKIADERTKNMHGWPKGAHILSGRLKRSAPSLRATGIDVAFPGEGSRGKKGRQIVIEHRGEGSVHKRLQDAIYGNDENYDGTLSEYGLSTQVSTEERSVHTEQELDASCDAADGKVDAAKIDLVHNNIVPNRIVGKKVDALDTSAQPSFQNNNLREGII